VGATLAAMEEAARKANENTMPALLEAARAYATMGEMMGVLRKVFGEYTETAIY